MGGIFGVIAEEDISMDLFFGTDYHSHLGTRRGGLCVLQKDGFSRAIHNIQNSPFRSKFEDELADMVGNAGLGSISDTDPQPLTVMNRFGEWALATVGRINNKKQIFEDIIGDSNGHMLSMSHGELNNTELVAALISEGEDIVSGIKIAQEAIDGSVTMLLLNKDGLYAARDKNGRTPMIIGKSKTGYCAASESFAFINVGYEYERELGPGEIVRLSAKAAETVSPPGEKMRICSFLWSYFGYTTSIYEGRNVELMRNRNGKLMAEADGHMDVDYVAGVPDSGIAHALGYANGSNAPYARPLIKYTPTWPRSFMPQNQRARNLIAKMKLVPVFQIIRGKKFVLIDDSIVRGTQLAETVSYLTENGAEEIHVRSACPPIMYGCKYLNFSRSVSDLELITRRCIMELEGIGEDCSANPCDIKSDAAVPISKEILDEYSNPTTEKYEKMVELIRIKMGFDSLKFQKLDRLIDAIGIDHCKLCTYCWDGKE